MRPAFFQVYSGSTLYDIQGVVNITNPNQVYELGVWMNGPATFSANGEDWTSWGVTLASTDSKKMWDDPSLYAQPWNFGPLINLSLIQI